jgi:hypothetical protein
MSYTILNSRGTQLTVVADGTLDNTLSIKLIGKNYAGYGEIQNENLVYMLENFANSNGPNNPQVGQLWFDTTYGKLRVWDGSNYRVTAGCEITSTNLQPSGSKQGEFWYDTVNKQVYVNTGSGYVLVGPQSTGNTTTQMQSVTVTDTVGGTHPVILAYVGGQVQYIISSDTFTLNPAIASNPNNGFSSINKGINLANSSTNVNSQFTTTTGNTNRFWGTATDSDSLGGYPATAYLRSGNAGFTNTVQFSNNGFWLGDNRDILFSVSSNVPTLANIQSSQLVFQVKVNGAQVSPLTVSGINIIPDQNTAGQATIGTQSRQYNTVYATNFSGTATQSSSLLESVSNGYRVGNTGTVQNTVAVRDNNADLFANVFQGIASSADYGDLAEKYTTDKELAPGTVVCVGGTEEMRAVEDGDFAVGVISTDPAYMMNSGLANGTYVALKGRVPCYVTGHVKKGDRLSAASTGYAKVAEPGEHVFAVAIETFEGIVSPGKIEVLVL